MLYAARPSPLPPLPDGEGEDTERKWSVNHFRNDQYGPAQDVEEAPGNSSSAGGQRVGDQKGDGEGLAAGEAVNGK